MLGRPPREAPPPAAGSPDREFVFEVKTEAADRITVLVDLQSEESCLAGEQYSYVSVCLYVSDCLCTQWNLSSLISSPHLLW